MSQNKGSLRYRLGTLEIKARRALRALADRPMLARLRRENALPRQRDPLISVTIATYNRAQVLTERTLPSVLAQTYQNFEVIVVGDHCTDDTAARIAALNDSRIRFYNQPERGKYPEDPQKRRFVAGIPPMNKALELARGAWIAHLDDDDVWIPEHLEKMLAFVLERDLEFGSSILYRESFVNDWGDVWRGHSTFFAVYYLKAFRYDPHAWRFRHGADAEMLIRLNKAGVRMACLAERTAYAPLRPNTTRADHLSEDRT